MAQSVYKITTDQGEYNITVDDAGESTPQGPEKQSTYGALTLDAIRDGFPLASRAVKAFAEAPNLAKQASSVARGVTAAAAPIAGAYEGGMRGFLEGSLAAAPAGWQAGKGAYFGTKMLQGAVKPIAAGMAKPVVSAALHELTGIQGLLDLAQMAEPNRTDIGFIGMGGNPKSDPEAAAKAEQGTDEYLKSHGYSDQQISELRQRSKTGPTLNTLATAFEQSIKNAPEVWAHVLQSVKQRMSGK